MPNSVYYESKEKIKMDEEQKKDMTGEESKGDLENHVEGEESKGDLSKDAVTRMIQSAVDKSIAKVNAKHAEELAERDRQIEELKKKTMTAEELEKEKQSKLAEYEQKLNARERSYNVMLALSKAGLDADAFGSAVSGKTPDEIADSVAKLKASIEASAKAIADKEIAKRNGGNAPKGGNPPDAKTMSRDDFDKLDPSAKMKFMRDGGKLE